MVMIAGALFFRIGFINPKLKLLVVEGQMMSLMQSKVIVIMIWFSLCYRAIGKWGPYGGTLG